MLYKGAIITDTGPGPGLMLAASLALVPPKRLHATPFGARFISLWSASRRVSRPALVHWEGK